MGKPTDFSEVHIEDDEGIGGSEPLGIKEIALEQYRKCCVECSKEMSSGGIQKRFIKGIGYIEVYIPNQREVFINHVDALQIIMQPHIVDHKKLFEDIAIVENRIKNQINKFIEHKDYLGKQENNNQKVNWAMVDNQYEPIFVDLYKDKLIILSKLLKEMNYLGEASAMG